MWTLDGGYLLTYGVGLALVVGAGWLIWHFAILTERMASLSRDRDDIKAELDNLRRAQRNKLYRTAIEDIAFAAQQARLRIHATREELDIAEKLLDLHKVD